MSNYVYESGKQSCLPTGRHHFENRHAAGQIMLCYGSCEKCGWWCACPEGGVWPSCPGCGADAAELLPKRAGTFDPAAYRDFPGGEPKAFLARFMTEAEALEELTGKRPYTAKRKSRLRKVGGLLKDLVGVN